jgi:hypothetical protein
MDNKLFDPELLSEAWKELGGTVISKRSHVPASSHATPSHHVAQEIQ